MDAAGIIALVVCAAAICTKILFLFRERGLDRTLEHDHIRERQTKLDKDRYD